MSSILSVAMLTQSDTFLVGSIAKVFAVIMNFIFDLVTNVTTANSLAITIIVFTLLVKFLLMPLMVKQQKSMRKMQLIQPKMQKLQKKYENRKDPESQQQMQVEMQKLYRKNNVSPFSGCLPMFIQLPIFFALYQVFRYAPAYIDQLNDVYMQIANILHGVDAGTFVGNAEVARMVRDFDPDSVYKIIDVIYQFKDSDWNSLYTQFAGVQGQVEPLLAQAKDMTSFLGLFDLSVAPGWGFPHIIIPIIAAGSSFIQSKLMMARSKAKKGKEKDKNSSSAMDSAMQSQKVMMYMMPLMMGWISVTTPAGLSIYWVTSNIFQIVQQFIINRIMDNEEEKRLKELRYQKAKKIAARKRKLQQDSLKSSGAKKK